MKPDCSIIVLATNEITTLRRTLPLLFRQSGVNLREMVLIDSGSTDGTLPWLDRYSEEEPRFRVHKQTPADFHHARTRNLGLDLVSGEIIVLLAGDASPEREDWLASLIAPILEDDKVAGCYGRQRPRPDADTPNRLRSLWNYKKTPILKDLHNPPMTAKERCYFSTVNCALHRERLGDLRFDEEIPVNEDVSLSWRLLNAGWKLAYAPQASVIHSHNLSPSQLMRRYFDNAVTYRQIGIHQPGEKSIAGDAYGFGRFVLRSLRGRPVWEWAEMGLFLGAGALGILAGRLEPKLPRPIARWFSQYGTAG